MRANNKQLNLFIQSLINNGLLNKKVLFFVQSNNSPISVDELIELYDWYDEHGFVFDGEIIKDSRHNAILSTNQTYYI